MSGQGRISDRRILELPSMLSDREVAATLHIAVSRVTKVRDEAAKAKLNDGRRKMRPNEPEEIHTQVGDKYRSEAPAGCTALLKAHLAYHAKHNPKSKAAPLWHTGRPR